MVNTLSSSYVILITLMQSSLSTFQKCSKASEIPVKGLDCMLLYSLSMIRHILIIPWSPGCSIVVLLRETKTSPWYYGDWTAKMRCYGQEYCPKSVKCFEVSILMHQISLYPMPKTVVQPIIQWHPCYPDILIWLQNRKTLFLFAF